MQQCVTVGGPAILFRTSSLVANSCVFDMKCTQGKNGNVNNSMAKCTKIILNCLVKALSIYSDNIANWIHKMLLILRTNSVV